MKQGKATSHEEQSEEKTSSEGKSLNDVHAEETDSRKVEETES